MSKNEKKKSTASFESAMDITEQVIFLNSILEGSTEYSIVAKDLEGTILAWNEGAKRIYGYEASDVVGKEKAFILHDPEDVKSGKAQSILDEARKIGRWAGELKRVRKNGSHFTAFVTVTLRKDAKGNPIGFTMISHDITESQKIMHDLKESQAYNRGLIESNIDALMTTDPLGIISDVNQQMCEMTEFTREELIGSPFKDYFTDAKRAENGIRKVLAENRVTNYELVMRSKTNKQTMVSYNATTFRSADGRLKGVFAAARDITDQKRLEEDLRQAQNYTRGLIEASVDALLTIAPDLKITDVNEQTVRITGYSREDLIGSDFPDYFIDSERASTGVQKTLAEGFVTDYVLSLRSKNNKQTLVSFNASVFKDTEGKVRGIFAAARDITKQRNLEEKLRQAQNYTRGLIESSIDAMLTVDQDFIITDVNEQMVKLSEVNKDALIGSRFDNYFTEPKKAAAGVRKTLSEGYVTNYELTLRTPSGHEVLVSFNASIFRDPENNIRGIFAVARDVTEQRRLEQQLREQKNYNRSLIESSVDALMTVDPSGIITDVNEQTVKLTGYNRKQLIGSSFVDYFTEPELAHKGILKTFDEGAVTNYELIMRSKSDRKTPVSFNASVFHDTAGTVIGIFAAAREITQQKNIEDALREQQNYTRGLIESSIDALMTTDTLGIITDVNRQMCAITDYSREELIGTPFKTYFTDPRLAEDGIRKVLMEDRVFNYELTIHSKKGRETVVSYNATTFKGTDGHLRGVFASARDITNQKMFEEQLRKKNEELEEQNRRVQEANRLKSEFLANMSHELRSPLNGIIGFAELMHNGKVGPVSAQHKEYLGDILTSSRHLLQLINDVLDLSKVEAGKMEFFPETVDLEKLIGEVCDILHTEITKKTIKVEVQVESTVKQVTIDPAKLKQVFYNYLSNAIKFSPDNGLVTIRVGSENTKEFRLEIEDNGIGIRPDDLGRLFIEFQQLDASIAKKYQGTGLGLSLTKRIVEAQGGKVGVTSTFGKGSVFYAILPKISGHPKEDEEFVTKIVESDLDINAPSILIIEDDAKDREYLADILTKAGYQIKTACSGTEAIRISKERHFDAITLDLLLPDMSGWELLKTLRTTGFNQQVPVIVVTVVAEKAASFGFMINAFLVKPIQPEALIAALQRINLASTGTQTILLIDDDQNNLKLAKEILMNAGYKTICKVDVENGLQAVHQYHPAAIILDLLMPKIDGFEFLLRLRQADVGRHIPVIVWTVKDLNSEERQRLQASAQAIVTKSSGSTAGLLKELKHYAPLPLTHEATKNKMRK